MTPQTRHLKLRQAYSSLPTYSPSHFVGQLDRRHTPFSTVCSSGISDDDHLPQQGTVFYVADSGLEAVSKIVAVQKGP